LEEESTFQRTTSPTRPPVAAAKVTFQEEYRRLLAKYGIAFDERYVWD
jgi:hypothetical protein